MLRRTVRRFSHVEPRRRASRRAAPIKLNTRRETPPKPPVGTLVNILLMSTRNGKTKIRGKIEDAGEASKHHRKRSRACDRRQAPAPTRTSPMRAANLARPGPHRTSVDDARNPLRPAKRSDHGASAPAPPVHGGPAEAADRKGNEATLAATRIIDATVTASGPARTGSTPRSRPRRDAARSNQCRHSSGNRSPALALSRRPRPGRNSRRLGHVEHEAGADQTRHGLPVHLQAAFRVEVPAHDARTGPGWSMALHLQAALLGANRVDAKAVLLERTCSGPVHTRSHGDFKHWPLVQELLLGHCLPQDAEGPTTTSGTHEATSPRCSMYAGATLAHRRGRAPRRRAAKRHLPMSLHARQHIVTAPQRHSATPHSRSVCHVWRQPASWRGVVRLA